MLEDPENVNENTLSIKQQQMLQRTNEFWRVWSSEYLKNLPPACQKFKKAGNLEVGSVVMIRDDLPRMKWNVGIVEKLSLG